MLNISRILSLIGFSLLAACVATEAPPLALKEDARVAVEMNAAGATAADRIATDLAYLADDARAGREAGTEGYEEAARYVAARFDALGLEAAGDRGGWFQSVTLRSVKRDPDAASFVVTQSGGAAQTLAHLEDYVIGRSMAEREFSVEAPIVFVRHGLVAPEVGLNDYAGVDARGKIVIVYSGAPDLFDSEKRAFYQSTDNKIKTAAANGAVGFITLPSESFLKRFTWDRLTKSIEREAMTWVHPDGVGEVSAASIKATATLSPEGAEKLFANTSTGFAEIRAIMEDKERAGDLAAFDLGKTVALKGASAFEEKKSSNVAGLIQGSDKSLDDEIIVLTGHLDHVGVYEPRKGGDDFIHNGAMDNAMGISTMLEVARSFQSGVAPKRSILFLAVTAEEKGLLGADYFVNYPTVDEDIVANVNLDMPLTLFPFSDVIAFGAERSTLGGLVKGAAGSMNIGVTPDPIPEQGIFTRSDHYRFVEKGVPSVFLIVGFGAGGEEIFSNFMKEHYHQPSDDLALPIDYASAARFAELNYRIARSIADAPAAPSWIAGDFFATQFAGE